MKRLVAALAILTVAGCGNGSTERAERPFECPPGMDRGQTLTLFHETHTHGNLAGGLDRPHDVTFARYVGLRNALRECLRDPNASLFLGNGDDLGPELRGVRTEGRHTIDAFNAAGIDADTFGFSELNTFEQAAPNEESLARLRELVAASDFAWVSANVRDGGRPEEAFAADQGAQPWIVRDVGGVRVGITGLLARYPADTIPAVPPGLEHQMRVLDPVAAMRDVAPRMRTAGAELVVVLSHLHHTGTLRVVRSVEGIDMILGTHHGPPTPEARKVGGAIVAVAGPDEMQALGQLDLTVVAGRIVDHAFTRHVVEPSHPVDRNVQRALSKYR
jgi:2',3'-cyclic-nucleotide 2'-phosphodiesterase (5'-nucleotidase family)